MSGDKIKPFLVNTKLDVKVRGWFLSVPIRVLIDLKFHSRVLVGLLCRFWLRSGTIRTLTRTALWIPRNSRWQCIWCRRHWKVTKSLPLCLSNSYPHQSGKRLKSSKLEKSWDLVEIAKIESAFLIYFTSSSHAKAKTFLSPTALNHTLKFSSFKFLIVLSGLPIKYPSVEDDAPVEDPFNGMSPLHWVVTGMSFVVLSLFRHEGLGFYFDRSHRLTTFFNSCQMPIRNCTIRRSKSATRTEMDT